jgi:hypothetical protein
MPAGMIGDHAAMTPIMRNDGDHALATGHDQIDLVESARRRAQAGTAVVAILRNGYASCSRWMSRSGTPRTACRICCRRPCSRRRPRAGQQKSSAAEAALLTYRFKT